MLMAVRKKTRKCSILLEGPQETMQEHSPMSTLLIITEMILKEESLTQRTRILQETLYHLRVARRSY